MVLVVPLRLLTILARGLFIAVPSWRALPSWSVPTFVVFGEYGPELRRWPWPFVEHLMSQKRRVLLLMCVNGLGSGSFEERVCGRTRLEFQGGRFQ